MGGFAGASVKGRVLAELDRRKDELLKLCCDVVRIPSENPPGDTTAVADFLTRYIEGKGIKVKRYEPKKGMHNLVAVIEGTRDKPNFVLNAHMDEFIADVGKPWSFPPFAGEIKQGKILGRGVSDMKGGLAASLFAFVLVKELGISLPGKLTMTLVSDEESGGKWGAEWLLDNVPEARGDACINGEPSGTDQMTIGEKAGNWFKLTASGISQHAAYSTDGNAVVKMAKALVAAQGLRELAGVPPADIKRLVDESKAIAEAEVGKGAGRGVDHVVVNAGTIRGGVKVNMVPAVCEAELDTRAPWGVSSEQVRLELEKRFKEAGVGDIKYDFLIRNEPNYTSPNDRLVQIVQNNAKQQTGKEPQLTISLGLTDLRFWRRKGIPALYFGPRFYGMAGVDEYITIEDLLTVARVHAGTVADYFGT